MNPRVPMCLALVGALSGCLAVPNERVAQPVPSTPTTRARPDDAPSVLALDRSNWQQRTYTVGPYGVAHTPTYRPDRSRLRATARQRGAYPTVDSALDVGDQRHGAAAWEAASGGPLALLDALLILPRMVFQRPWAIDTSPAPYQRDPDRRWDADLTRVVGPEGSSG